MCWHRIKIKPIRIHWLPKGSVIHTSGSGEGACRMMGCSPSCAGCWAYSAGFWLLFVCLFVFPLDVKGKDRNVQEVPLGQQQLGGGMLCCRLRPFHCWFRGAGPVSSSEPAAGWCCPCCGGGQGMSGICTPRFNSCDRDRCEQLPSGGRRRAAPRPGPRSWGADQCGAGPAVRRMSFKVSRARGRRGGCVSRCLPSRIFRFVGLILF